jgi:hypothetical protein
LGDAVKIEREKREFKEGARMAAKQNAGPLNNFV